MARQMQPLFSEGGLDLAPSVRACLAHVQFANVVTQLGLKTEERQTDPGQYIFMSHFGRRPRNLKPKDITQGAFRYEKYHHEDRPVSSTRTAILCFPTGTAISAGSNSSPAAAAAAVVRFMRDHRINRPMDISVLGWPNMVRIPPSYE